ncbi:MAG TPA: NAD-dependent epimerase/dehydratase family protein [Thermoanaerobaculia bacterium]|nr:NAD-dependent epimerase/dehydratase family protein [Thermoanaerobaculia bacterium]
MSLSSVTGALAGRKVLVTGAGGFIGGRLVERLVLEHGAEVRTLVRNLAGAARLARFPVTVLRGDVTSPSDLASAMAGCSLVFHCAYGTSGSQKHRAWVNTEGTRRVLAAARQAGVERIVHLSTLMVYGRTADGDLDEAAPRRRFGNPYSDSKLEAERIALSSGLPVAVLQPTAVYGPYGGVWTEAVLRSLKTGRQILVDGGEGFANAVYVDDLVSAMLLAAVEEAAVGEAFLISGEEPVTWRELFGRFAGMLGSECRTVEMTAAEALAFWRRSQRQRPRALGEALRILKQEQPIRERIERTREVLWLRETASSLLPESWQQRIKSRLAGGGRPAAPSRELPIHPLSPELIAFFRARTRVRIDKAKRSLGYEPAFDFAAGMELTEKWARWANLL